MFLKDILAISGHSGLFQYIKQGRNGIIVESLEEKKRMNAPSTAKISSLEDITIFSVGEKDIPLEEIIKKIFEKEKGGPTISHKLPNEELKAFFEEIIPEYNKEKVYVSDIKKVINWYNILQKLNLIKIEEKAEKEEKDETAEKKDKEDIVEKSSKPKTTKPSAIKEKESIKAKASSPKAVNKPAAKKAPVKNPATKKAS